MNTFTYSCYVLTLAIIRLYKWVEYGVLLLAQPLLKYILQNMGAKIGIIFHDKEVKIDKLGTADDVTPNTKGLLRGNLKKPIHIVVNCEKLYSQGVNTWFIALGDGFVNNSWDIVHSENWEELTECFVRIIENRWGHYYFMNPVNRLTTWFELEAFNLQAGKRAETVGEVHYDIGNELYETMLDPWMQYTCGYWKTAKNLNEAQLAKMEMICQKLELKPGMTVLDVGCGWGTLAKYMAEKYGAKVTGITIGKEGALYGQRICKGLPVEIRLQDYMDVTGTFDRIVSVGAFEHFGPLNYRKFFKIMSQCLKDDGILLLHTIGMRYDSGLPIRTEGFLEKYIFPNGLLPYETDITKHIQGLFLIEDWHNFGLDYAKTLYCWKENFINGWPKLEEKYGGEKFFRMWIYYLCLSRACFISRQTHLWQVVLSKGGLKREYRAYR